MAGKLMKASEAYAQGFMGVGKCFDYTDKDGVRKEYRVTALPHYSEGYTRVPVVNKITGKTSTFFPKATSSDRVTIVNDTFIEGGMEMIKTATKDAQEFVKENRSVIYWISIIMLADHFIFKGSFRDKLKTTFNALIDRVNASITTSKTKG